MNARRAVLPFAILAAGAALATVPWLVGPYWQSLLINILMYTALSTAWALFSGPTRYVSLATVAFFGLGAYTVAFLGEQLPWPAVLAAAACAGAAVALLVGLSTLRLSGVYFVVFTFGLAELVRQLVTWSEAKYGGTVGRFIFVDVSQRDIYWQLLGLCVVIFLTGLRISHSRLGWALRAIGEDEMVARHSGIDATRTKVGIFVISAMFMTIAGAIMAPRWTYIDPTIAFNPVISFEVLIMALLGGAGRLYGPLLGVIPLTILFEFLSANFPNHFSILLGLAFLGVVYFVPNGVAGVVSQVARAVRNAAKRGGPARAVP